jgi:predicted O-methyltransferase YrrM
MNWNIKNIIVNFTQNNDELSDVTDARFHAPASKNPVEYETAGLLYSLTRSMKAHTVVETGTNIGLSSLAIAQALEDDDLPGSHLLTYDITDFGVSNQAKQLRLDHRLTFFKQSSLESDLTNKVAKIDLLFLDSLTELLEDEFNLFWQFLRKTSRVVIHDTRLYEGKQKAIDNIVKKYKWSEVSFPAGRGVTILSPGKDGLLAKQPNIQYGVIFDARKTNGVIPLEKWATQQDAPKEAWIIGAPEFENALLLPCAIKKAHSVKDAFFQATESQVDYILYLDCAIGNINQHLSSLWERAETSANQWDYIASDTLSFVDAHTGPLELQQISQRWITDKTQIRTPQISSQLFLVNTQLLKATGGFIEIPGDEQWSFSLMVARLVLANGICIPEVDLPSIKKRVYANHPPKQAGSEALHSAIGFYRHMPRIIRKSYLTQWHRLARIYYYGINHEDDRLLTHLLSKPLKLKDWWQIIYHGYLSN